jgi:PKD repeat protein
VSDAGAPGFGWQVRGDVGVEGGAAVLREGGALNAGLRQSFLVPPGASVLRFTFAAELAADASAPPDAFEVALLDPTTGAAALGTAAGLTRSDALLNLQADGRLFVATGVSVDGSTVSGGLLAAGEHTVEIDLAALSGGAGVTLFLDLLGAGAALSRVTVDGVAIDAEVENQPPVVDAGPDAAVTQGVAFAGAGSFTDADSSAWTATVDYGDGAGPQALALTGTTFALAHTYATVGTFTVTVAVTDAEGHLGTDALDVDVLAAPGQPPIVSVGDDAVVGEGQPFARSGSFTDADSSAWTATVDYGDGDGPQALTLVGTSFDLAHTYVDDGAFTITVTVTDAEGHVGTDALGVDVRNAAPEVEPDVPLVWVRGAPLALGAAVSDAGLDDTFEIAWSFGDGTGIAFAPLVDLAQLHPVHVFTDTGTYAVTLTVRDDDGGEGTATSSVEVRRAAVLPDPGDPSAAALFVGGSTGADRINLLPVPGAPGQVSVVMDGSPVGAFGPVVRIVAYGQRGNDTIFVSPSIVLPTQLHGGDGSDSLSGGSGPDVLLGDGGVDQLNGRTGADILIGGAGVDGISGGGNEDLLIAGGTAHDNEREALAALAAEWTRTDASLAERMAHLTAGGGLNGDVVLTADTVYDDAASDFVDGGEGLDWLFVRTDGPARDRIVSGAGDVVTPTTTPTPVTVTLTPVGPPLRGRDLLPSSLRSLTLGEVIDDPSHPWEPGFTAAGQTGVLPQLEQTLTPALSK